MKWPVALAALLGLGLLVGLIVAHGAAAIGEALAAAGWGILLVIALHLPQVAASALGWRAAIVARAPAAPVMFGLRLIREAINALLPVAQVGGDVIGARLLAISGVKLGAAAASVAVDFTLQALAQAVFTLLGLLLLLAGPGLGHGLPVWLAAAIVTALGGFALLFMQAQRMGLFQLLERGLLRLAARKNWTGLEEIAGLHLAIVAVYRSPRRVLRGFGFHLLSWLLGGLEVWAAFYVLGTGAGLRDALIVESLGQAGRALGFAVPGALGIQEAGIVLACGLVGIGPQAALEVSLLKRIRELALGVPGLLAWYGIEWLHPAPRTAKTAASEEAAS